MQPPTLSSKDRAIALALGLLLLAIYLATHDLSFHMIDETGSYIVTRNLVTRGSMDSDVFFWVWVPLYRGSIVAEGIDGHTYLTKDFAPLLLDVPFVVLGRLLNVSQVRAALFLFPIVTALTGALVYAAARIWDYSRPTAALGALTFGLGTLAWPYAGMLFSQPLAALGLLIALVAATIARERGSWLAAFVSGLGLGLGGASSSTPWIVAPIYILYLLPWDQFGKLAWRDIARRALPLLVAFGLGVSVFGLSQLLYNAARFGSPLSTGHDQNRTQDIRLLYLGQGSFGQSISTIRGLIWFAPFSLLIPFGIVRGWRVQRRWLILTIAQAVLIFLFTSSHYTWWGGHAWGPRYLLTVMPLLALLVLPVLDQVSQPTATLWTRLAVGSVLVLSTLTQLMAVLFDYLYTEIGISAILDKITPPQVFFAYHPALVDPAIIPQIRLIQTAQAGKWDVLWMSGGRFDSLLLGCGIALIASAVLCLILVTRQQRHTSPVLAAQAVLTAAFALFMLTRYSDGPYDVPGLDELAQELSHRAQPGDGVIPVLPQSYLAWIDQYDSSVHDTGIMMEDPLSDRTRHKLEQVAGWHDRVWLVTEGTMGGNPANGVELWLAQNAFAGVETWIEGYRLIPYTFIQGDMPFESHPVGAAFGDSAVMLDSYAVQVIEQPSGGGWLNIRLAWSAASPPDADYTVFVHLLAANGVLAAQHDGLPMASYAPTRSWLPGDVIQDQRSLSLPDTLPPGEYRLMVGLYNPLTGERVPLASGSGDSLFLTSITLP